MVKSVSKKEKSNVKKTSVKKSTNEISDIKKPRKGSTTKEMLDKMNEKIQNFTSN
jgi:hypothetical protein